MALDVVGMQKCTEITNTLFIFGNIILLIAKK